MMLTVLTAAKSPGISSGLSYESQDDIPNGSLVTVPLRNATVDGIVIGSEKPSGDFDLKSVRERLSEYPVLTSAHIATMRWMAEYYHCSLRHAMRVFLPSPPWSALLPKDLLSYRLAKNMHVKGLKQQMLIDYLEPRGSATWDEIRSTIGVPKTTVDSLLKKGIIETVRTREFEGVSSDIRSVHMRPTLSSAQQTAANDIRKSDKPTLLFGVTGSGKTEVYADLIADMVEAGKQSIVLVPEILLTEATIHRFAHMLNPQHIEVLHSGMTAVARREAWKRIRFGNVKLIIGSRSALFAPVTDLGLVVIDEEHEWTYKNEQMPRYHARETAEFLCKEFGATLVLGSATPSLEAWHRAKEGRYSMARIDDRYGSAEMPLVKVVDLAQVKFGNDYPFSNTVFDAIEERLKKKEQTVLFLNRRGVATSMMCMDCRRRMVSPDSNLPFTVHKKGETLYLQDHTTGAIAEVPSACPACGSTNMRPIGAGTQRVEDILKRRFPHARLQRADSDTLAGPEDMRELLANMREQRADILLGTQSVVKGLDLPNVTLAVVLVADVGMSLPHFRAGERVFQLLTQLTGRSGRAKPGEVVIQTFRPDAQEIKTAALHETEQYLDAELAMRKHAGYPPCTELIRLIARGPEAKHIATAAASKLVAASESQSIGCAPTLFGGGREWHILIRGDGSRDLLTKADLSGLVVDIDPMDCV